MMEAEEVEGKNSGNGQAKNESVEMNNQKPMNSTRVMMNRRLGPPSDKNPKYVANDARNNIFTQGKPQGSDYTA